MPPENWTGLYDWKIDPDLVWPEDKESKMIQFKITETSTREVTCNLFVQRVSHGGSVNQYVPATEADLNAAGYYAYSALTGNELLRLGRENEELRGAIEKLQARNDKQYEMIKDLELKICKVKDGLNHAIGALNA